MLDKRSHLPLYIQLKDELIKKIMDDIWEVETQIPSEKLLMDEYSVGRATVREAISILVNDGYLYKRQGIGTFVASKQPSVGFEPLISLTYSLKARGINPVNIIENKKIILPEGELLEKLKWKEKKGCFYLRRMRFGGNIPVAIEESYFSEEYKDIGENYDLTGSLARIILRDMKLNIKRVEQVIVPRVPTREEQEKLGIDGSTMVLQLERWIYVEDSEDPFYYLNFIIPGNIYSFS